MHHNEFVKALPTGQRNRLNQKSNIPGLVNLAFHWGSILVLGYLIASRIPLWPLLLPVQGILIAFLFTLLHETSHATAFATDPINRWVAKVCGFAIFLPPLWFRYFHFAHHRHTQDPDKDPELMSPKPETFSQYVLHISGIPVWASQLRTLLKNAFRECADDFVPPRGTDKVRLEALLMLALYLLIALACVLAQSTMLLYVWIIPVLLGQPFLRWYLLAEHGRCAFVANMFENTRTTFTNSLVRKLAWNMPYHTEHHAVPTVPFHKLPELHKLTCEHLKVTENGYASFNRKYVAGIAGKN